MKLTVNKKLIHLPADASISLTKKSPIFNDEDAGSFSYPFPVPTVPNEKALNFPGRLTKYNPLPDQDFVLEHGGRQILKGVIDYEDDDAVSDEEIGLILKSGYSKFVSVSRGKKLSHLDFGSTYLWPETALWDEVDDKIAAWNLMNSNFGLFPGAMAPCLLKTGSGLVEANKVATDTGNFVTGIEWDTFTLNIKLYYVIQFKVSWLLQEVFEQLGFVVLTNEFADAANKFQDAVVFSNPFCVDAGWARDGSGDVVYQRIFPYGDLLYADLMPDMSVVDFLDTMKDLFCLHYDYKDEKNQVSILFKDAIFAADPVRPANFIELKGRLNGVRPESKGYSLQFDSQDNPDDTESDYEITDTSSAAVLPAPEYEGQTLHFETYNRDYIAKLDETETLYWSRIGKLKAVTEGDEDLFDTTIKAKVPTQVVGMGAEVPEISVSLNDKLSRSGVAGTLSTLYVSVYRGKNQLTNLQFPLLCADEYTLADESLPYPPVHYPDSNLQPATLIDLHFNFLEFHRRAIPFTKYFKVPLREVMAFNFSQKLTINGVSMIFVEFNIELPYRGIIKVKGYTAPTWGEIDFGPLPPDLIL